MMDEVESNGGGIKIKEMSDELGVPVVAIAASKNEGIGELADTAVRVAKLKQTPNPGQELYSVLKRTDEFEKEPHFDKKTDIASLRYAFIDKLCKSTVVKPKESKQLALSLKVDNILTNKYLAIPIFLTIMGIIFWLAFGVVGSYLSDLLAGMIDFASNISAEWLKWTGADPVIRSLIIDGVFAGIGSVLSFIPVIAIMFFFLSILEDSGYMARVAFVMDRLLSGIGLSGRSFVPMLIGFGCSVPAIMATRTLSSDRDRKMTILLTPFMSCSAKLPIYGMFAFTFFPEHRALVMISLYVLGMVTGVLFGAILNKTAFRGDSTPFIMELPNYRLPSIKSVGLLMWGKIKDFLTRAFTIIFLASIIIWFLQTFDFGINSVADSSDSILAAFGRFLSPVFTPLGFGDWRASTSLLSGFIAKEAIISTLAVLTGAGTEALPHALSGMFTPLTAFVFLVFTLLYTPCVAAVSAVKREMNSWKAAGGVILAQTGIAWVVAFTVYQIGILIN
jgi:ferrous iron transport protein B